MQPRLFLFICEGVKPVCKSIITTKEVFWRLTVFSLLDQTHFQWECMGHLYSITKITIFKTLRRLDTTWNFAHNITRVSTHEHEHWEPFFVYTEFTKKKVFEQLTLAAASPSSRRHGSSGVLGDRHAWAEFMWFSWAMCRDPGVTMRKVSGCVEPS